MHTRRTILLAIMLCLALALPSGQAARPRAAPPPPPYLTPGCPQTSHQNATELLASLPPADYTCAEALAQPLAWLADEQTFATLLQLSQSPGNSRTRRNALRVLGRFAEQPPGTRAHQLTLGSQVAALRQALHTRLDSEQDAEVLHDTIWICDTFLYPTFGLQPALAAISANSAHPSTLRARAAAAVGRLIYAKTGTLPASDQAYLLAALQSDDNGVRARAALIAYRLRDNQLDSAMRATLQGALAAAWAADGQPLAIAEIVTDNPLAQAAAVEASTNRVLASANLALALDHFDPPGGRFARYRTAFEATHLSTQATRGTISIRAGLPAAQLPAMLTRLEQTRTAFLALVGPALAEPLPDDQNQHLTILLFGHLAAYRAYMAAFVGLEFEVDGIYSEQYATLYSYQRGPGQSANSLEESLAHEFGHYLAGRYIFPGSWFAPGYHAEPKGWADEGLAEVLAGLSFDAAGNYQLMLRPRQLSRICGAPAYPSLASLLERRAGYDRFGRFDYDYAWALSFYLLSERRATARALYLAFRSQNYHLASFAQLAEVPSLGSLQADWYAAIRRWCQR